MQGRIYFPLAWATGFLPFTGVSAGGVFDAILHKEPTGAAQLNTAVPMELQRIIDKVLEKDRELRYNSAAELRTDLKRLKRDSASGKLPRRNGDVSVPSGAFAELAKENRTSSVIAPVTSNDRKALAAGPVVAVRRKVLVSAITFLAVATLIAVAASFFGSSRRTRIGSVAVLPFANASGDSSMEYLSDGITEGVIDRLSGLPNLKVISRTSAFRYKQRDIEPQKVAKDLGVDALVTGRVVQRGDDLSVNAELVDAREHKQLWGEQYNRKFADIVSIQQEIATAISGNLRVRLASEEKTRVKKSSATNPEAYQLYLKGRFHANQATAAGLTKSIEYFQHAIDRDPGFALAYAGLAESYNALGGWWIYLAPAETLPKAKAAAMKALELDDMLAEAHAALATAEWFYDWNWSSAEWEFRRAIELNPNSAISHAQYCGCLLMRARFDESLAECQRAQELDPLSPGIASQLGYVHLLTRRYNESIAQFQKALELYPNAAGIRAELAWAYAMMGMYPQALAEYDKIADQDKTVAPENQLVADGLGWVYAVAGQESEALRIAQQVKELSSRAYVDSYQFATIYAGLRDKDEVFRLLEKGYKERSAAMSWLAVDLFWESVRSDPRYTDLLRRIG